MMRGNKQLANDLASLFGSDKRSDCTIMFCQAEAGAQGQKRRRLQDSTALVPVGFSNQPRPIGDPLPGHKLILGTVSEFFAEQLDQGSVSIKRERIEGASDSPGLLALMPARPTLWVPLESEDDLEGARTAIAYAYTGELKVNGIREALQIWRCGAVMRIQGLAAACKAAIKEIMQTATGSVSAGSASASVGSSSSGISTTDLKTVLDLFACQHLWPLEENECGGNGSASSADGMQSFATLLQSILVTHFGDALRTLNTPALRQQLLALPVAGLDALLSSDTFAADSEASMLLLLATWMCDNHASADPPSRMLLVSRLRLVQLNRTYLSLVLPALALDRDLRAPLPAGWFPLGVMDAAFIARYSSASAEERKRLDSGHPGLDPQVTATYRLDPRPQPLLRSSTTYTWHIRAEDLWQQLQQLQPGSSAHVYAMFDHSDLNVAVDGLQWAVSVEVRHGQTAAGLYLWCGLPPALQPEGSTLEGQEKRNAWTAVDMWLSVDRWRIDRASRALEVMSTAWLGPNQLIGVDMGSGEEDLLPLRQTTVAAVAAAPPTSGAPVDVLAPWAEYIRAGRITGSLQLENKHAVSASLRPR